MSKKTNKKGVIEDFGEVIIAGILIIIVLLSLSFYANYIFKQSGETISYSVNRLEATKFTRVILNWEFDDGEKVYQRLIRACNNEPLAENYVMFDFVKDLEDLLNNNLPPEINTEFVFYINGDVCSNKISNYTFIPGPSTANEINIKKSVDTFQHVLVPNPEGEYLKIIIKEIKKADRYLFVFDPNADTDD